MEQQRRVSKNSIVMIVVSMERSISNLRYTEESKEETIRAYQESNSLREIGRSLGV